MDRSYGLTDKGAIHDINIPKQRITIAGAKIRRYNQKNTQYYQNNMLIIIRGSFTRNLMERRMCRLRHQIQRDQLGFEASYGQ